MAIFLSKRTKVESHRIILESSPNLIKRKNFMAKVQLCQDRRHYEETVYFLPLSAQKTMALIWLTLGGWKAELILEPPNSIESGTLDLESSDLNARSLQHPSIHSMI